jgi:hypothetical protein
MLEFAEVIMKSPKKMTNAEFMQQLMNYSPFGGLIQPYIIPASVPTPRTQSTGRGATIL